MIDKAFNKNNKNVCIRIERYKYEIKKIENFKNVECSNRGAH
jgi:hypothetical protein